MEYTVWLNGEFIPRSEAKVGLTDRGFLLGDAIYDTSRTFNGEVFRLRDHLKRFYRSARYTRIDLGMSMDEMEEITREVISRNESVREPGDDYMITQIATRGAGYSLNAPMNPTLAVWIDPLNFPRYAQVWKTGASVVIPRTRAYQSDQVDPKIKHYNQLNFVMADLETHDVDPDAFSLLLDTDGNLTEGTGGNFFLVTNGVLKSPTNKAILEGVSRMTILELAEQLDIPTSVEDLQPYDAYTADEAILCSTPFCLMPVAKVDNRPVAGEVPGPITKQLMAAWTELVGMDVIDQINHRAEVLASR